MKRKSGNQAARRGRRSRISLASAKDARFSVIASLPRPVYYDLVSVADLAEGFSRQVRAFGARRRWLLSDRVGPAARRSAAVPVMREIPDLPATAKPLAELAELTNAVLRSEQALIRDARRLKRFLDANPEFNATLMSWGHARQVMVTFVLFAADAVRVDLSAPQVAAIVGQVGERPDHLEFAKKATHRKHVISSTMYKMRRKLLPVLKKTRWSPLRERTGPTSRTRSARVNRAGKGHAGRHS